MLDKTTTNQDCTQFFGKIECREIETSLLTCLSAFLNMAGIKVRLTHLLGLAPIAHGQSIERKFHVLCRRLGMQTKLISNRELVSAMNFCPLLAINKSGYCFVVLRYERDWCSVILPGIVDKVCKLRTDDALIGDIFQTYIVRMNHLGPAIPKTERSPKLYLFPWSVNYEGQYDRNKLLEFEKCTALLPKVHFYVPKKLTELHSTALLVSHASICPDRAQYYGRYREFNLKRGDTVFVDFTQLSLVVGVLLSNARSHRPTCQLEVVKFSAKLFSDFLAIHPFVDANQRMAMQIVSKYLSIWNFEIHWQKMTSSQIYYWTRLATRGHICFLEDGFNKNIVSI